MKKIKYNYTNKDVMSLTEKGLRTMTRYKTNSNDSDYIEYLYQLGYTKNDIKALQEATIPERFGAFDIDVGDSHLTLLFNDAKGKCLKDWLKKLKV